MVIRLIDFLSNQHPFVLLGDADLHRIAEATVTETVPAGTRLLEQGGDVSQGLYLLDSGTVRLARGDETVRILETGDCFGYPSILGDAPPAFDAIADERVTVHRIPADLFKELLEDHQFAEFFLRSLSERLQLVTRRQDSAFGGELTLAIGSLELRPPVRVRSSASVAEAARAMRDAHTDVVLVDSDPPGILTDHDFQTRVLAEDRGPTTSAAEVMTRPLKTLPSDAPVHTAILFMLEHRIHHLPVTDGGDICSVLSATDLLRHQTRNPLYLMRQLEDIESPEDLSSHARRVTEMAQRLFEGGLKVGQIGRICSSISDALARRVMALTEYEMGSPPCPYAWLVFGSEGRSEQVLIHDQDNALAFAEDSPTNREYFARFAARAVELLILAGVPPCPGGYMASNWCQTLGQWKETVDSWIRSPDPQNLMMASIFFDVRSVAGELGISSMERQIAAAADNELFMMSLAREALTWRPPLGLFHRIRADDGHVDIKSGGLAPIVSSARLYGLLAGSPARATRERLEDAMSANLLSHDLGRTLIETYRFLQHVRLRSQLVMLRSGGEADNRVDLRSLSPRDRGLLKDGFGAIRSLQSAVAQRFRTQV